MQTGYYGEQQGWRRKNVYEGADHESGEETIEVGFENKPFLLRS